MDELNAARQRAQETALDEAVADGRIAQEQADLIRARQALQSYLDPEALFAQALGVSTEDLQNYHQQGLSISQILDKAGKTAIEVREALQAAHQAALQQAVSDGVITQDQADQLESGRFGGMGLRAPHAPGFEGGRH